MRQLAYFRTVLALALGSTRSCGGRSTNTFGNFQTIAHTRSTDAIDTVTISLTNPVPAHLENLVGLDNLVLAR